MLLALTVYSAVAGDMAAGIRFSVHRDFGKINPKYHVTGSRARNFFQSVYPWD